MNMQQAIKILLEKGYKMTKRRIDMLSFFSEKSKYKTAKDVYQYMEDKYPGISYDTVYRNLHLYHDLGILESTDLNAEKHFRMRCEDDHHHHFICKRCGKTKKINFCPMEEVSQQLSQYKVDDHKFEIYGTCPTCLAS